MACKNGNADIVLIRHPGHNLMTTQYPTNLPTYDDGPEPRQLWRTQISAEERQHHLIRQLCFYCRQLGHRRTVCPSKLGSSTSKVSLSSYHLSLLLPVQLHYAEQTCHMSLIDSGLAINIKEVVSACQICSQLPPGLYPCPM